MSEKIDQFISNLHGRLTEVDNRIQRFKANVNEVNAKGKADIQAQLDKARTNFEEHKHKAEETKQRLEASIEEKKSETEAKIEEWRRNRQIDKLERRAQRAEEYAAESAYLAWWSVEEAEYAMLEAIAARIEADEAAS